MNDDTIIIACDFKTMDDLAAFLEPFQGESLFLKIGMELFYREGAACVHYCKQRGHRVFLDLKLHDIPNTVANALANLKDLEADYITLHASGGMEMMKQAVNAVSGTSTRLLAVTVLTSINQTMLEKEQLNHTSIAELSLHYADMAQKAGVHGCICSAHESKHIKETLGDSFLCITPGIRLEGDALGDQQRVLTPAMALANKADQMVIGRSITQSSDPYATYQTVKEQLS